MNDGIRRKIERRRRNYSYEIEISRKKTLTHDEVSCVLCVEEKNKHLQNEIRQVNASQFSN
jgi:hypothetical protein